MRNESKKYWSDFYAKGHILEPSTFAIFIADFLNKYNYNYRCKNYKLLDLGCGNGRDTYYFYTLGYTVKGFDLFPPKENIFYKVDFSSVSNYPKVDIVYSRFSLHSITLQQELKVNSLVYHSLEPNGFYCIEVRSLNDGLFKKGTKISDNEYIFTHYRRFFNIQDFKNRLISLGFSIVYCSECFNMCKYKDDNATVIRVIARK